MVEVRKQNYSIEPNLYIIRNENNINMPDYTERPRMDRTTRTTVMRGPSNTYLVVRRKPSVKVPTMTLIVGTKELTRFLHEKDKENNTRNPGDYAYALGQTPFDKNDFSPKQRGRIKRRMQSHLARIINYSNITVSSIIINN